MNKPRFLYADFYCIRALSKLLFGTLVKRFYKLLSYYGLAIAKLVQKELETKEP